MEELENQNNLTGVKMTYSLLKRPALRSLEKISPPGANSRSMKMCDDCWNDRYKVTMKGWSMQDMMRRSDCRCFSCFSFSTLIGDFLERKSAAGNLGMPANFDPAECASANCVGDLEILKFGILDLRHVVSRHPGIACAILRHSGYLWQILASSGPLLTTSAMLPHSRTPDNV